MLKHGAFSCYIFASFGCNPSLKVWSVVFDISKAFDKFWRIELLFKLKPMWILGNLQIGKSGTNISWSSPRFDFRSIPFPNIHIHMYGRLNSFILPFRLIMKHFLKWHISTSVFLKFHFIFIYLYIYMVITYFSDLSINFSSYGNLKVNFETAFRHLSFSSLYIYKLAKK